ncbi:MAG: CAP domain-containing protein [Anaerolineales bacterium]|nr:CAP domain-containing protein [Anaerolineales bacterium]
MLTVVRLVSVMTLCAGLGSLSPAAAAAPFAATVHHEHGDISSAISIWGIAQSRYSATDVHLRGATSGVPPWLEELLQRVSKWLDGVIDVVAAHAPEPAVSSEPSVVVANPAPAPASLTVGQVEASLVAQTNAARAAAGLPPLQVDAALTELARQRSQDMIDRDFFSHTDPVTGGSLVQAYCIAPLGVAYCGENLAGAGGLADAESNVVGRWLASDGHRANMLRTEFGRVGIGVAVGGRWGAVVTQLFAP